jgi:multiple sugar transport system permease protein
MAIHRAGPLGQETKPLALPDPAERADRRVRHAGRWYAARAVRYIVIYGLLLIAAAVAVVPISWMVLASFKPMEDMFTTPMRMLPNPWYFQAYPDAWATRDFTRYFLNSFFVSASITLGNILFCSMAGYALAKFKFRGRQFFFLAILSTLMLPLEVTMVPLFLIVKDLHWQNTYQGMIVPFLADAFGVFLMRQYILGIPDELIEAARIDGMHEIGIFSRIVMPLSTPAAIALAIFQFREAWDMYIWPLIIITKEDLRPVTVGVALFMSNYSTIWNQLLAVATIAMIPMVVMFFVLQRYFIRGIVLSGLKG